MVGQVARNLAFGLFGNLVGLGLQLVASIVVARSLGVMGFGVYVTALAFATLFSTIADAGVTNGLARELAVAPELQGRRLLGAGLLIKSIGGLLIFAAALGAAVALGFRGEQLALVAVMLGAYLFSLLLQTVFAVARARGRMELESALVMLQGAIFLLWVLGAPKTPLSFGYGWLAAYSASAAVGMAVVTKKLVRPSWVLSWGLARQLWAVGLPLMFAAVLIQLYGRVGVYLLTALSTPHEAGLFGAAQGLTRNLQLIAFTLSAAAGPVFAQLAIEDAAKLRAAYTGTLRAALLIAAPIATGSVLLATPLMRAVFGEAFASAGPAFAIGSCALACFIVSYCAQALLTARVQAGRWLAALGIGTVVSVAVGALLVPSLGARGAADAALAADLLILALTMFWTRASIDLARLAAATGRVAVSAGGMGIMLLALQDRPLWLNIPVGAAVYALLCVLTRAVERAELSRAWAALPLPVRVRRQLGAAFERNEPITESPR